MADLERDKNMHTSSDPKPHRIIFRVNDETNDYLNRVTTKTGKKVSEYIRELIEHDMKKRS